VVVHDKLVTWTGRSIVPGEALRYRALSEDAEKAKKSRLPQAVTSIYQTLWQFDSLETEPGNTLAVCEGPFDALRLDFYGRPLGLRATCFFGKSIGAAQIALLDLIAPLYKRKLLMLDNNSLFESYKTNTRLAVMGFNTYRLPDGVPEPEKLSPQQVEEIARG
jgi:hypothetical protein